MLFREWSKGQRLVFCTLALTCLITNMVYSIQAPIFPGEAHKKNATSVEYGIVFGIFQLTQMFMSPLIGSMSHYVGVSAIFVIGILLTGLSTAAFGFLKFIPSHFYFIATALVLRVIEAIGTSAIWIGVYTFAVMEFPDSFAATTGALEGFNGLALTIGPFVGSILYNIGGFLLPFTVTGGLLVGTGGLAYLILKDRNTTSNSKLMTTDEEESGGRVVGLLLAIPPISLYMLIVIVGAVNMTCLLTILEEYLHQFHLTHVIIGLVFLANGFANVVSAPLASHLCGVLSYPEWVPLSGFLLFIAGFSLLLPTISPDLTLSLWYTLGGVVLIGLGAGCSFSPSFILSVQSAERSGMNSCSTTSQISGLWLATFAFGAFLGPILAGFLNHHLGFTLLAITIIAIDVAQILCICCLMSWNWIQRSRKHKLHIRIED